MSRDSAGTYTAPSNSFNPAVEGSTIDETDWNATLDDLESALTDSLDRTGKGKITAHVDFDETTVSSPAANVGRLYVKDVGGVTSLFFKDNGGTDTNLLLSAPGLAYTFSTSTTTTSDPGSGIIRFNDATISSVTEIAVDDNDANGADISAFILSWDDQTGTDRGKLIIQNRTAPANVAIFRISGASVDGSGWTRLSVTYVTHNGSISSNAPLGVTFAPSGATGLDGVSAGLLYQFSTSTTTTGDPGAGYLRLNNATLASVTEIAVDDQSANSGNPDVSALVLAWDDSTSTVRGTVTIKKATALQNYAIYNVTGASIDESGWTRLTVTHVGSSGSFSNNDSLGVEFVRTGDLGATGSTGATGAAGSNGTDPGIRWLFDSSTTMADPGSGDLRLNNATLASVTAIAISDNCAESGAPSVETFVLSWDDSTTTALRGTLIIKKVSAPQNFAIYNITGASTNNAGWTEVVVTHVDSSGSLSNGDTLAVQFFRSGSAGAGSGDVTADATFGTDDRVIISDGTAKGVMASLVTIDQATGTTTFGTAATAPQLSSAGFLDVAEIAAPATPSASHHRVYAKSDGKLYRKNSAGTETELGSASGEFSAAAQGFNAPINLGLAVSAAGNALTIAIKGADGNDPSASNPVHFPFRSSTLTTGTITWGTLTAASSIVVSSGSTLGIASGTAFRVWIVMFDNAGVLLPGVVVCSTYASTAAIIGALAAQGVASATNEGGAGGADSARTFYSSSAVSSKPFTVLGYAEWSASGLVTAGAWTTTNLLSVQVYGRHVPLPGSFVQVVSAFTSSGSSATSTTFTNVTGSSISITPISAANFMRVQYSGHTMALAGGVGVNTESLVTIARGGSALGPGNVVGVVSGAGTNQQTDGTVALHMYDHPNSVASQTYTCQHKGINTNAATTTNNLMGTVEEVMT